MEGNVRWSFIYHVMFLRFTWIGIHRNIQSDYDSEGSDVIDYKIIIDVTSFSTHINRQLKNKTSQFFS